MRKSVLYCTKISLLRFISSSKTYVAVGIILIFSFYIYTPMVTLAHYYQCSATPWLFPFFLSYTLMPIVYGGTCIILFVDVFRIDGYSQLMMIRCGKGKYLLGQVLYIAAASLLFVLFTLLLSLLFVIPVLGWDTDWGILLYTLARNSGALSAQTGIDFSFVVSETLLTVAPVQVMLVSFICMWLVAIFVGSLIGFFRIFVSETSGIIAAGVFLGMVSFSSTLGFFSFGRWIRYLSPLSWADAASLDWSGSGLAPSPGMAIGILGMSIVGMSVSAILKFRRKDI